jgi:hypothetical protein
VYNSPATLDDIQARLYTSGGTLFTTINVASSVKDETHSSVAMTSDGRFDIAYEYAYYSTDHDIYLSQYSSTGTPQWSVAVSFSSLQEVAPSVSVDNNGNAVVVYEKDSSNNGDYVEARRVTSGGKVGNEFTIAGGGAGGAITPSVALSRTGGSFVVAYVSTPAFGDLFYPTVYTTEASAFDKFTGPFK